MRTKILILMELSALEPDIRSFGGVDSVCQMHLEGLRRHGDPEVDYVILGFNPANDLASNGEVHALAPNIRASLVQLRSPRRPGDASCPMWRSTSVWSGASSSARGRT